MKTRTTFIVSLTAIIILLVGSAFGAYSGGTGEPNDPYQIADANDLLALAADTNDYSKCFILTADVNMHGQVFTTAIIAPDINASIDGFQGTSFSGSFDGNSHTIDNFNINGAGNSFLGLFGRVNTNGSIKNLGLKGCNITGSARIGSLVGLNQGQIKNCYSTSSVSGNSWVGGLIGYNDGVQVGFSYGKISQCHSAGVVSGHAYTGGLVGYNNYSDINNCYSSDDVNCSGGPATGYGGGLIGYNYYGDISNCYSTGSVNSGINFVGIGGFVAINNYGSISNCYATGNVTGSPITDYIGGLVGYNLHQGIISNCYTIGNVNSPSSHHVGGLVGFNGFGGSILNCYTKGNVTGSGSYNLGGLVGYNDGSSDIRYCYSIGTVNGFDNVGGLLGVNFGNVSDCFWDTDTSDIIDGVGNVDPDPNGAIGKTTAEMKILTTFTSAGWDFIETWGIGEKQTYPYLRTELAGDLNHDTKVDFKDFAILSAHWLEGTE